MSRTSSADVEERIQSLISTIGEKAQQLAVARNDLKRSELQWRSQVGEAAVTAADRAEKALTRNRKAIEANAEELRSTALSIASKALERYAPAYLSAEWTDRLWSDVPPESAGEWLRVGTVAGDSRELPFALPLSAGVWRVVGPDQTAFSTFVHNVVTRAVAAFDPSRVRVLAYDPGLALDLAAFAGLRAVSELSVPPAITSEEDFERILEALRGDISSVDDRLTASGLDTYWNALAAGHPLAVAIPLRLLIIGDDPRQLTERGRSRLDQIRRLAADRGLLVVESGVADPSVGSAPQVTITLGRSATASNAPGVSWVPDAWAGDGFIRTLSSRLADRPRQSLAPTLNFEQIVRAIEDPWLSDTDEGLETVIGTRDGGDLTVHMRSENPPMPNALVGGAVGQGKSNLLLVLIHGLAARYSPAELEMVLVDLRDGVEFARLGPTAGSPTWLPHVRALGLEFDPDYCIAVLQWVRQQMTERSNLLKASGATTLKAYHEHTGKVIPRLLVVIDEFQRLFEGDDDQAADAAALLESIARTGRGFGIHLVLASQAITGIRGLAAKADAIFGQFHNRVLLRNTPAESQAFLTAHNLAATELEHRGQVVVNQSLGAIDSNVIGTVAYADPDYLERLQVRLFQQGHGTQPSVFRASAFGDWRSWTPLSDNHDGISAAVGLPISVEAIPRTVMLSRSPNQGLAVVGTDRVVAMSILVRAVTTAVHSLGGNPRVTILDGDSGLDAPRGWLAALTDYLAKQGAAVERVGRGGIAQRLIELSRQKGNPDLVIAVALDSVDLGTPVEPDYLIPNESLRELLKNGPLGGTWTIGWWQSAVVLEEQLGYRAPGIRGWGFCGVSRDDLISICGPAVREPAASPRFVWFDRTGGSGAERLVPFNASDIIGTHADGRH